MHPLLTIAKEAARKAGDIIIQSLDRLDSIKVTQKDRHDFVSQVDLSAERAIINIIQKAYPEHGILGEETGEQAGTRDNSTDSGPDEYTWIIDPLDGTTNFLHNLPHYAVSIAVKRRDKLECAMIYDPVRHEFFSASRGGGCHLNDRRLRVSGRLKLDEALIGTGFPFRQRQHAPPYLASLAAVFEQVGDVRRAGAAALDLAYVAAGRLDGFWEVGLNVWDTAAGILLIKEAGGLVSDFSGGETYHETGNIVAGSPKIFKGLLPIVQPHLSKAVG